MKIWLRINKVDLTRDGRTVYGTPIQHDEFRDTFNSMGIECFDEYPVGDAVTAERHVPPNPEEYLIVWTGSPDVWEIDNWGRGKAVVGLIYCGETILPPSMINQLDKCDVVFVGSTEAQKCFSLQFRKPPLLLAGGIIPELFPYIERDYNSSPFTFLQVGADWRKGTDLSCDSFVTAFPSETDVNLIIISPGATPMFLALKEKFSGEKRIVFIDKLVSDRKLMATEYYGLGHCLLYPSIMEGWGRCLTEGMSTGMPVICFKASSMLDQFQEDCGWWIEPEKEREFGYLKPSISSMSKAMREAYLDRNKCKESGLSGRKFAVEKMTWTNSIKNVLPILEKIYEGEKI